MPQFPAPSLAWLTVNRACNYRCKWCYATGTGYAKADSMSLETALGLVGLVHELGVEKLHIIGGEPTLWRHILPILKECEAQNVPTSLVTNSVQFASDRFWNMFLEHPATKVGLSLKAASPQQLVDVAGAVNFAAMERALKRAIAHYQCGVSLVYNSLFRGSLVDLAQFAMDCGVRGITMTFCRVALSGGTADSSYAVSPSELASDIIRDYPRLMEVTGGRMQFELNTPLCIWPRDFLEELRTRGQVYNVCQVHHRKAIVFGTDGSLLVCNALYDYPLGYYGTEFTDAASLVSHMNSDGVNAGYDVLRRVPCEACVDCKDYNECGGGCPLLWTVYDPLDIVRPNR